MTDVKLETWEYEWASHVGARRYIENWEKTDAAHYKRERMQDDRTAQVAACVAELAVAKTINAYWSGHVWSGNKHRQYKHIADVGNDIEVKRVRANNDAAVRRKDLGKGLVLFVVYVSEPELRSASILGWLPYDEAWTKGTASDYDPENTRTISNNLLHEPARYANYRKVTHGKERVSI
tara:strand:- start:11153 stop:11689 length:537 start_codon:yes stop_codon:yes gene_type:complete